MKIIAIIPARGGSKGIPRKNIKTFCGKPLIYYIINSALNVKDIEKVIVSTEDEEVAEVAKRYGAEIIKRPKSLAEDEVPTLPVLQHAVKYLKEKENYKPDVIVLLYPTSPLLKANRILEAIKLFKEKNFDSLISVVEDKGHFWVENNGKYKRLYPKVLKNRQYTKPLFRENGAIYICKRNLLMERGEIVGGNIRFLKMNREETIDIDEPFDFEIAEFLMRRQNNEKN